MLYRKSENNWLTNNARWFWLQEAYRKWVCSSLVPYFAHRSPKEISEGSRFGSRLRPCRSFCQTVEQRCPYFLPGDRAPAYPTQYAGEPTFLCRGKKKKKTREEKRKTRRWSEWNASLPKVGRKCWFNSVVLSRLTRHLEEGYKCSVGTLLASQVCEE